MSDDNRMDDTRMSEAAANFSTRILPSTHTVDQAVGPVTESKTRRRSINEKTRPHVILPESIFDGDTVAIIPDTLQRLPFQPDRPANVFPEQPLWSGIPAQFPESPLPNPLYATVDDTGHRSAMKPMPDIPGKLPEVDRLEDPKLVENRQKIADVVSYIEDFVALGSFTLYCPEPITITKDTDVASVLTPQILKLGHDHPITELNLFTNRISPVQSLELRIPDAVSITVQSIHGEPPARLLFIPDVEWPDPAQKEPQVFLGLPAQHIGELVSYGVPEFSRLGLNAQEEMLLKDFPLDSFSPIFRIEYKVKEKVLVINDQFFENVGDSFRPHEQGNWVNVFAYVIRSFDSFAAAVNTERVQQAKEEAQIRAQVINNLRPKDLPPVETMADAMYADEIPAFYLNQVCLQLREVCTNRLEALAAVTPKGDVISVISEVFVEFSTEFMAIRNQGKASSQQKLEAFKHAFGLQAGSGENKRDAAGIWDFIDRNVEGVIDQLFVDFVEAQVRENGIDLLIDVSAQTHQELHAVLDPRLPTQERRVYKIDGTEVSEEEFKKVRNFPLFYMIRGKGKETTVSDVKEPSVDLNTQGIYEDALVFLGISAELNQTQIESALQAAQDYETLYRYMDMAEAESIDLYTALPFAFKYEFRQELYDRLVEAGVTPQEVERYQALIALEEEFAFYNTHADQRPATWNPNEEERKQRGRKLILRKAYLQIQRYVEQPTLQELRTLDTQLDRFAQQLMTRFEEAGMSPEQALEALPDKRGLIQILLTSANECLQDTETIKTVYMQANDRIKEMQVENQTLTYFKDPRELELGRRRQKQYAPRRQAEKLYQTLAEMLFEQATRQEVAIA